MNVEDKFNALAELLKTNDFAYVASLWSSLNDQEKTRFKLEIVSTWNSETILSIYESFCFINKSLAKDILGYEYKKAWKEKRIIPKNSSIKELKKNEGKESESWEEYIDFKVKYLQAFKERLNAGGFNPDLVSLLIVQELAHLNDLSLGGKGNEQK